MCMSVCASTDIIRHLFTDVEVEENVEFTEVILNSKLDIKSLLAENLK